MPSNPNVLNFAPLQLAPEANDIAANLAKGEVYYRRASLMGADIALLPEMTRQRVGDGDCGELPRSMGWHSTQFRHPYRSAWKASPCFRQASYL